MAGVHDYSGAFTLDESVELARAEREGHLRPMHVSQEEIRAWLQEQRLRWAKAGHPAYQHLLQNPDQETDGSVHSKSAGSC